MFLLDTLGTQMSTRLSCLMASIQKYGSRRIKSRHRKSENAQKNDNFDLPPKNNSLHLISGNIQKDKHAKLYPHGNKFIFSGTLIFRKKTSTLQHSVDYLTRLIHSCVYREIRSKCVYLGKHSIAFTKKAE